MDLILKMIDSTNTFLWSYILIVMLISLGIYFTLRTKFVQFRYFGEMFRLLGDGGSKDAKKQGIKAARTSFPVLLTGETGTGKEVFANAIHNASDRRDKPIVSINCAAIPAELLESELFGYEEGSFTDDI